MDDIFGFFDKLVATAGRAADKIIDFQGRRAELSDTLTAQNLQNALFGSPAQAADFGPPTPSLGDPRTWMILGGVVVVAWIMSRGN